MYIRNIFRAQLVGARVLLFKPVQRIYGAQVAALKPICFFTILNIFISLNVAELLHNKNSVSSVGGCGKPSVSHPQEVWRINTLTSTKRALHLVIVQKCSNLPVVKTFRDHSAPKVMRWSWQRRLAESMALQVQPSSPKWLIKASLQILFMKMTR